MKKRKLFFGFFIIFLLFFSASIILNKTIATDYNDLDENDKLMLKQVSEVYSTYRSNGSQLWSENYDISNNSQVFTSVEGNIIPTKSYVMNVDDLNDSLFSTKIKMPDNMDIPAVYRVNILEPHILFSSLFTKVFSFLDMGNNHCFLLKYSSSSLNDIGINENSFKRFLVHESFHEFYQVPHWNDVNNLSSSINLENRSVESYQIFILENIILDKAFKSNDSSEIYNYMYDWAVLREIRLQKYPEFRETEGIETLEGSAYYEENKLEELEHNVSYAPILGENKSYYFSDIFNTNSINQSTDLNDVSLFMDKDIYYNIGWSLGKILDKVDSNDWKRQVDNGTLIPEYALKKFKSNNTNLTNDFEEIKLKYNYDNYYSIAKEISDELKKSNN